MRASSEHSEHLRATLYSIGNGVITTDQRANVTFMNTAAQRITGWLSDDAVGQPIEKILRMADEPDVGVPGSLEAHLRGGETFHIDEELIVQARGGGQCHIHCVVTPIHVVEVGIVGAVLAFHDITDRKYLQRALEFTASHDGLTGLLNRAAFEKRLQEAIECARDEGRFHTLCFVDLDRFKLVNDGAGHAAGDGFLREVASVLRQRSRAHDVVARIGGDEFAFILLDCSAQSGYEVVKQICAAIERLHFKWNCEWYSASASIGLAQIGPATSSCEEVMGHADFACYKAKSCGGNQISIYKRGAMSAPVKAGRAKAPTWVQHAIEEKRFCLFAQEIRKVQESGPAERRLEVLVRMFDENGGLMEPSAFIPEAEASGLMGHIDRWVVQSAFRHYARRIQQADDVYISINVSATSLRDTSWWTFVRNELTATGMPRGRVTFEMNEASVWCNVAVAVDFIAAAHNNGCRVSLDDFGERLGALTCLGQLPVDSVKIDGNLIREMSGNRRSRVVVESLSRICRSSGCLIVAEQVEDERTLGLVRSAGIDYVQGYAIARPARLEDLL